ncbi:rare lipoprotein A [Actinobacillus equuli]|nr:rare lipoprotein A [Actinobacillus equuli]
MTAAHKTLPFGTLVEVTNMRNGRSVVVRVNDRGPYAHARVVDLSKAAARQLGMHNSGTAHVKLAVLNKNKKILKQ